MGFSEQFLQYSLTNDDLRFATFVFAIVWALIGSTAVYFLWRQPKKLGWVISFVNSTVLMVVGIIYLFIKIPTYRNFWWFGDNGRTLLHSLDNVSVLLCIWFILANVADIFFGLIFYRRQLDPLTAYVHHVVYIWLLIAAITGNGGFATIEPFASGIVYMFVEEVPTFLLALGSLFPACRTDVGFGVTFFLLRLVYHSYMLLYSMTMDVDRIVPFMFSLTLALHVHWFSVWMRKYGVKLIWGDNKSSDKRQ
jgi:hypothetical protein